MAFPTWWVKTLGTVGWAMFFIFLPWENKWDYIVLFTSCQTEDKYIQNQSLNPAIFSTMATTVPFLNC